MMFCRSTPFSLSLLRQSLALVAALLFGHASWSDTLTISCVTAPEMPDYQYKMGLIKRAADQLGHDIKVVRVPLSKVSELYAAGKLDGDCGRLADFKTLLDIPDLEKMAPSVRHVNFSLWSTASSRDLKTGKVGYFGSMKRLAVKLLPVKDDQLKAYGSLDELIIALAKGDIDYMMSWEASLHHQQQRIHDQGIRYHSILATMPAHIFIHKKHQDLQAIVKKELLIRNEESGYYRFTSGKLPKQVVGKIIFSCALPSSSKEFIQIEKSFSQAFNLMGYQFEMVSMPPARSKAELFSGRVDGSCAQMPNILSEYSQLVKVPVVTAGTSIEVWSNKHRPSLEKLQFKDGDRLAYIRGNVGVEKILPDIKYKVTEVTSAHNGMAMLAAQRIDYFLTPDILAAQVLRQHNFQQELYRVEVVSKKDTFPFLGAKHKNLAEPLRLRLEQYLDKVGRRQLLL